MTCKDSIFYAYTGPNRPKPAFSPNGGKPCIPGFYSCLMIYSHSSVFSIACAGGSFAMARHFDLDGLCRGIGTGALGSAIVTQQDFERGVAEVVARGINETCPPATLNPPLPPARYSLGGSGRGTTTKHVGIGGPRRSRRKPIPHFTHGPFSAIETRVVQIHPLFGVDHIELEKCLPWGLVNWGPAVTSAEQRFLAALHSVGCLVPHAFPRHLRTRPC